MWTFANPVNIRFGAGSLAGIGDLIDGQPYCLVTYDEPPFAALADRIRAYAGPPTMTIDNVVPNPHFGALAESCAAFGRASPPPGVIVALGGGSVIDAAKVLAAAGSDFGRVRRYLESGEGADALGATPIIAVPTTAGTGSEVTCWSTVWDIEAGHKYSLMRPGLYPRHALIDPELTLAMPRTLTVATGLDALSHALESLWNVNANPVSATLAVRAARELLEVLPVLVDDLSNVALRVRAAQAALFAGLAFSNTKSALAHSLSYAITLRHGVPHGVACSFSLPMVMGCVIGQDRECDERLGAIFGPDLHAGVARLTEFLVGLGVAVDAAEYGVSDGEWQTLIDDAFIGERGKNFIGTRDRVPVPPGSSGGQRSTA